MKYFSTLIILFALSVSAIAQSKTVTSFSESAEGYNLYLYQSLIRMLNKDQNPDFNMLIRDLDYLKLVTDSRGTSDDADKSNFVSLDKKIISEGFESIMSIDNKDYILHLYLTDDSRSGSHWIATFFMQGMTGVMEMKGSLDTKYLHAFSSLNYDQLEKMLPLDTDEFKEDNEESWD